jgi:CRP-like cAMP-binding protein
VDGLDGRKNLVSSSVPQAEVDIIRTGGRTVPFKVRDQVAGRHERIDSLHFPLSGMVSVVTTDVSGSSVEVVSVGREGIIGVGALFGDPALPFEAVWQLGGEAHLVSVELLRSHSTSLPVLFSLAARYLSSLLVQTGQNAACNRIHNMRQRSAKWLLLSLDRSENDVLDLTQEFFATMLGVSRPKLSQVESALRDAGLVGERRRGRLMVLDRAGLEERTCECYWIIRDEIDGLLGEPAERVGGAGG